MRYFYSRDIQEDEIILSAEEHNHLYRVLRLKAGEEVQVMDGEGHLYHCRLKFSEKDRSVLEIISKKFHERSGLWIHILIAPTKNQSRIEWLIEKGTELGLSRISFIQCERSEKTRLKVERLQRVAQSALKQSRNPYMLVIDGLLPFEEALGFEADLKYVAHCEDDRNRTFLESKKGKSVLVLIGPEGDFTEREIEMAKKCGFHELTLGNTRLRTETAGLYAVAALKALSENT